MDWRSRIVELGLPTPPDGIIEKFTWRMRNDDYFLYIPGKGWFWLDSKQRSWSRGWEPSVYGPY